MEAEEALALSRGAKFTGALVPTLIRPCLSARCGASLRSCEPARQRSACEGRRRRGALEPSPEGGKSRMAGPTRKVFVWFYLTIAVNRVEKLNTLGLLYPLRGWRVCRP